MFERFRLTHDGTATVVTCDYSPHRAVTTSRGHSSTVYNLIVDVYPDGADPFRAEAQHSFSMMLAPDPGAQLKVRCNPETKKVEIDTDGDQRYDAVLRKAQRKEAEKAQHAVDLNAPIGTAPRTPKSDDFGLDPEIADMLRLDEEHRRGDTGR